MKTRNLTLLAAWSGVLVASAACGRRSAMDEAARDTAAMAADAAADTTALRGAPGVTPLADITGNPNNFVGKTVTVVADVEEVYSAMSFSLDEDSPVSGGIDRDLMVLSPKAASLANIDDQWRDNKVRVTGVIRLANVVELEREIGWDLDRKLEAELKGSEPVLIAQKVERVPD